jgi:hypothetical protein
MRMLLEYFHVEICDGWEERHTVLRAWGRGVNYTKHVLTSPEYP